MAEVPPPAGTDVAGTSAASATQFYVPKNVIPWVGDIAIFDIANGPAQEARSLLVRPTIHACFHWVPIAGIDPADGVRYLDHYIQCHYAQLRTHAPASMTEANRRKIAICLGVARAVAMSYYRVASTDVMPGELARPMLVAETRAGAGLAFKYSLDLDEPTKATLSTGIELSPEELAVVPNLLMCSIGILPLQGVSLLLTQHHYLSDPKTQSRKAYLAVEKQFWRSPDVASWYESSAEVIQDALWHKAGHPVNLTIKYRLACNELVRDMLIAAGAGSAAARLPALETEVRMATSYITLFDTVRMVLQQFGGGVDCHLLETAVAVVKFYSPGVDNPTQMLDREAVIPDEVCNRRTAVNWAREVAERNSPIAAWCYGFYCAMSEQSIGLGAAGGADTLRAAFSLAKLRSNNVAAYVAGTQSFGDYLAARAKKRDKGTYEAPKFVLA